jgi:hypothetical protein
VSNSDEKFVMPDWINELPIIKPEIGQRIQDAILIASLRAKLEAAEKEIANTKDELLHHEILEKSLDTQRKHSERMKQERDEALTKLEAAEKEIKRLRGSDGM